MRSQAQHRNFDAGRLVLHTSKCKRELKEGDSSTPTGAETVIHDVNVRVSSTQFRIDDNKSNCPISHKRKDDEKKYAGKETRLAQGVWKS